MFIFGEGEVWFFFNDGAEDFLGDQIVEVG